MSTRKMVARHASFGPQQLANEIADRLTVAGISGLRCKLDAARFCDIAFEVIRDHLRRDDGVEPPAEHCMHAVLSLWLGWCGDKAPEAQDSAYAIGREARKIWSIMQEVAA